MARDPYSVFNITQKYAHQNFPFLFLSHQGSEEDEGIEHGDDIEISGEIYAECFSEWSEKKSGKIDRSEQQRTYYSKLR